MLQLLLHHLDNALWIRNEVHRISNIVLLTGKVAWKLQEKVLTKPGLNDYIYDEFVKRLEFNFAVDLLAGAAQLAPEVGQLIKKRIRDMLM